MPCFVSVAAHLEIQRSSNRSWLLTLSTTSYHSSVHGIGESRSEDRTCNGCKRKSLSPPIFVARRMAALAEDMAVPSARGQRDNRQRPFGEVSGCDFRGSELTPLVQVFVDGLNGLRESWPGPNLTVRVQPKAAARCAISMISNDDAPSMAAETASGK